MKENSNYYKVLQKKRHFTQFKLSGNLKLVKSQYIFHLEK